MSNAKIRAGTLTVQEAGNDLATALNTWFEKHGPNGIFKNCSNCRFMTGSDAPAHCTKYGMTPPASVIIVGCPAHDDAEEIPF